MKYNFKVDRVILDIEHSARRFIEEKCPGSTPVIDITSDPRSIVAAYLINKIFPVTACAVYVEDRERDRVDDDVINNIHDLFNDKDNKNDRFIKISEDECESYRYCLNNYTYDNPIDRVYKHLALKYLYLSSKLEDKTPVIFDYHDFVQVKTGLSAMVYPELFQMLTYPEIISIAEKLNIDLDMLNQLYNQSDIIKEHERIIGYNILEFSKDLRVNTVKQSMCADLVNKYKNPITCIPAFPITVSTTALYDVYN